MTAKDEDVRYLWRMALTAKCWEKRILFARAAHDLAMLDEDAA